MRAAISRTVLRNPFLVFNMERKSDIIWETREILPTRTARFSLYQSSTLLTEAFKSAPTALIVVATGPMKDPSSVSACRALF